MRFADIACGSGSFLLGVYDLLIRHHTKFYNENPGKAKKGDVVERDDGLHLSLQKKREILLANVYGVDIDPQAVEVAQLSLYLKLLADETPGSARNYQMEFHETLLPTLNKNIVCGNSLIGTDILTGQLFASDEEKKLNPMDFEQRFPHIFSRGRGNESLRETATPLDFDLPGVPLHGAFSYKKKKGAKVEPRAVPEFEGGFDAIVGNPPYGFHQIHSPVVKPYFKQHYASSQGSFEHYFLFYERSLKLLRGNGRHGFIVPVTWLTIPSARSLRKFVLDTFQIEEISWLPELVFENAQVNTLVSIIRKSPGNGVQTKIYDTLGFTSPPKEERFYRQSQFIEANYSIDIFQSNADAKLLVKILGNSRPLKQFARPCSGYNPYEVGAGQAPKGGLQTKETVKTKPYHSETKRGVGWKPEIIGRNLARYHVNVSGKRWIKYGPWLAAPRDPENFLGQRILVQEITGGEQRRIIAAYCDRELYHSRDVIPIKLENDTPHPFYLLAIVNSMLTTWYHHKKNPKAQKQLFPKVLVSDLAQLDLTPKNWT